MIAWYAWLHGFLAVTLVTVFLVGHLRRNYSVVNLNRKRPETRAERIGLISVGIGFACYHLVVGPYTEIPSDFWVHLGSVVDEQYLIREGINPIGKDFLALLNYPTFVHFLHGVVAELLSVHPLVIVNEVTDSTKPRLISIASNADPMRSHGFSRMGVGHVQRNI